MRKIIYMAPIESMSGKWAQMSKTTYQNGDGTNVYNRFIISQSRQRIYARGEAGRANYFAFRSDSNYHPLSAGEVAARTLFATNTGLVRAAYADPTTYNQYRAQWAASGQKITLRQFIWNAVTSNT